MRTVKWARKWVEIGRFLVGPWPKWSDGTECHEW